MGRQQYKSSTDQFVEDILKLIFIFALLSEICNAQSTCIRHGTYKVIPIFKNVGVCTCNGGYTGKCCETSMYI